MYVCVCVCVSVCCIMLKKKPSITKKKIVLSSAWQPSLLPNVGKKNIPQFFVGQKKNSAEGEKKEFFGATFFFCSLVEGDYPCYRMLKKTTINHKKKFVLPSAWRPSLLSNAGKKFFLPQLALSAESAPGRRPLWVGPCGHSPR